MYPYNITLVNAFILLTMGLWGLLATQSPTAAIAPAFGLLFLLSASFFKKKNQAVIHIIVLLTLLLTIALMKPLLAAAQDADTIGIFRVTMMFFSCILAMIVYIRSFIKARKERA